MDTGTGSEDTGEDMVEDAGKDTSHLLQGMGCCECIICELSAHDMGLGTTLILRAPSI